MGGLPFLAGPTFACHWRCVACRGGHPSAGPAFDRRCTNLGDGHRNGHMEFAHAERTAPMSAFKISRCSAMQVPIRKPHLPTFGAKGG